MFYILYIYFWISDYIGPYWIGLDSNKIENQWSSPFSEVLSYYLSENINKWSDEGAWQTTDRAGQEEWVSGVVQQVLEEINKLFGGDNIFDAIDKLLQDKLGSIIPELTPEVEEEVVPEVEEEVVPEVEEEELPWWF